jgi:hypothetical protein
MAYETDHKWNGSAAISGTREAPCSAIVRLRRNCPSCGAMQCCNVVDCPTCRQIWLYVYGPEKTAKLTASQIHVRRLSPNARPDAPGEKGLT